MLHFCLRPISLICVIIIIINARTQFNISVHMYHIIFIIALYHVHTNHMYQFLSSMLKINIIAEKKQNNYYTYRKHGNNNNAYILLRNKIISS